MAEALAHAVNGLHQAQASGVPQRDEPNKNININKINKLYHIDFIAIFISI